MKASDVAVRSLNSYVECSEMIDRIEYNYKNIQGGFDAWNSGYECHLTQGAKNKIAAIKRRMEKMFSTDEEI